MLMAVPRPVLSMLAVVTLLEVVPVTSVLLPAARCRQPVRRPLCAPATPNGSKAANSALVVAVDQAVEICISRVVWVTTAQVVTSLLPPVLALPPRLVWSALLPVPVRTD
jgi:hypothetical protein